MRDALSIVRVSQVGAWRRVVMAGNRLAPVTAVPKHAVDDLVVGIECQAPAMRTFRPTWREGEYGERSSLNGDETARSQRLLRIDAPWVAAQATGLRSARHERAELT